MIRRVLKRAAVLTTIVCVLLAVIGTINDAPKLGLGVALSKLIGLPVIWVMLFIPAVPLVLLASWNRMWAQVGLETVKNPGQDAGKAIAGAARKAFGPEKPSAK